MEDRAPKPCYVAMKKQTAEREELYEAISPPGDSIPINIEPFEVRDDIPSDMELRTVVAGLRNGQTGGWIQGM